MKMKIRGCFLLFLVQATTLLAKVSVALLTDDTSLSFHDITGCPKIPPFYLFLCFNECIHDFQCKSGLKCCSYGCSSICAVPETYSCTPQRPDIIQYCESHCRLCKFGSSSKCLTILPEACRPECARDEECPAGKICCKSGCSKKCIKPTAVVPKPKYGYCPTAIPPDGSKTICVVLCNSDAECPGAKKCCKHGCTVQCMEPEHPGSCPRELHKFILPCRKSCDYDSNCAKGYKCCKYGCDTKCTHAITPIWS